jgi:hypothetical protein
LRFLPANQPRKGQDAREQQPDQVEAVAEIAPPQRRLLLDAPEPFEPEVLHPRRRTAHRAGDEIDDGAEVADGRHNDARPVALDPRLAFLGAERHDQQIRAAGVDAGNAILAAELVDRAVPGRFEADAHHAARLGVEPERGRLGDAVRAAEEVHRNRRRASLAQLIE